MPSPCLLLLVWCAADRCCASTTFSCLVRSCPFFYSLFDISHDPLGGYLQCPSRYHSVAACLIVLIYLRIGSTTSLLDTPSPFTLFYQLFYLLLFTTVHLLSIDFFSTRSSRSKSTRIHTERYSITLQSRVRCEWDVCGTDAHS
jgi:hypothetical protein